MQNRTFTDQLGRVISVPYPPQRIISLVPSQTELLFDLGLDMEVVGITKFCIHPRDKFISIMKIGGTKKLNLEKIRDLKPDLIIGNKEENEQGQIEELMEEFPVWMSDIQILDNALEMIALIGSLTGKEDSAKHIAVEIKARFQTLLPERSGELRVAYFIWKNPYMLAGRNTFIHDVMLKAGFINAIELNRYPELNAAQIRETDPDVIFLSSEPYPFKDEHVQEMKMICPNSVVLIADGELFSWYGSRLLQTPTYLRSLINQIKSLR